MKGILQCLLPLFLLPLLAALPTAVHGHEVEVLETYLPSGRVELGPGQEFHLRIACSADPFARIVAAVPCSLAIVVLFVARKLTGADRGEAA